MRAGLVLLGAGALLLGACEREQRDFGGDAAASAPNEQIALSTIAPGGAPPLVEITGRGEEYEGNAYQLSEGERLFHWFNCTGCHGNGGGGSGPPLIDSEWLYGSAIENIAASIREGRPNGMPSWRGRIPEEQIWQIAAYVRSMAGAVPDDAEPGRNDDMSGRPGENRMPPATPDAG